MTPSGFAHAGRPRLRGGLLGLLLAIAGCNGQATEAATPLTSRATMAAASTAARAPAATATATTTATGPGSASASAGAVSSASAAPSAPHPPDPELARDIEATLGKLSAVRGLPFTRPVPGRRLGRDEVIARITAKVERDSPPASLQGPGEVLGALELIPPDYDFVAGVYALLRSNLAGFYDPDDGGAMFLLNDLGEAETHETLVHELVHALQDQSFGLEPRLKYRRGAADVIAAVHALGEGEATSATFDVSMGSALNMPVAEFRRLITSAVASSPQAATIPAFLRASLAAPYADGYAFVQEARAKGGWKTLDAIWQRVPVSTEQILHFDKYERDERPVSVPVPALDALGEGWSTLDDDVIGEQTLRLALEQWTTPQAAATAAAGWAGDRYVVAVRNGTPPTYKAPTGELAVAWVLRFDSVRDATELAAVLGAKFTRTCRERPKLGSMAWAQREDGVAIVVGPYQRDLQGVRAAQKAPGCAPVSRWLKSLLLGTTP
ncbi:MAG: hypothetical protein IT373_32495 [Polyangiaceae bacterium]|nr:hypothetical protein [Polyangiaceae bacterium]